MWINALIFFPVFTVLGVTFLISSALQLYVIVVKLYSSIKKVLAEVFSAG